MSAYYNEIDKHAAAWLRELIKRNLIAPGDVDERSITDVAPDDLDGYTQCHFFAGIGGWSYALRLANWPDEQPVATGSCPCQPFSSAGKGAGTDDERHLWPAFRWLIAQREFPTVFGEQVASKLGRDWLSGVRADLENMGYAVGAADLCAAGVGAPHIRQRLWWVADAGCELQEERDKQREARRKIRGADIVSGCCGDGGLGDTERDGREMEMQHDGRSHSAKNVRETNESGDASTSWGSTTPIPCGDGKTRIIESGITPLAHGIPARVVRLRGYGNAIVPQVAAEFISAYVEATA